MASKKKPHRNIRFRRLLKDRFNDVQKAMADALEISPNLVSRYASDKGIGEDMRIHIEQKLKLPAGWFDEENSNTTSTVENDEGLLKIIGKGKNQLLVTDALRIAEFLNATPEQQDKALKLIKEEQTRRSEKAGNGNEGDKS